MSFESRFEERLCKQTRRTRTAEAGAAADNDGSARIDPVTSTPGQRPTPEGLVIYVDHDTQEALADTSWQNELGTHFEKRLVLIPILNGERVGSSSGSFVAKKDSSGKTITDRYFNLGSVIVLPTVRQPDTRKKGIDTTLLAEMEKYARNLGASRIEGDIGPDDIRDTPSLPSFYENRGYQLTPKGSGFTMVKPLQ